MSEASTVYFPDPGKEIHRKTKMAAALQGVKLGVFVAEALADRAEKILSDSGSGRKFAESAKDGGK